jgi:predicted dehydrogenase
MQKTYNFGIIGLGRIAHKFAHDLQLLPNARVWAVAAQDQTRANEFGAQYGATHCFGSYEGLLDCPDLDVVYVATPHVTHAKLAMMLLEHKIPCIVEKPFAMNPAEAKMVFEVAKLTQTFVMEALWTRFLPHFLMVEKWITDGEIGEIKSIKADFGFHTEKNPDGRIFNKALGGGSLLDVGIYPLFLTYFLLGYPKNIQAYASIGDTGVDESCMALLGYEDQKLAQIHSSIVTRTDTEAFIYGTLGNIKLSGRWHERCPKITLERYGHETLEHVFDLSSPEHGYLHEAQSVMECLAQGLIENPRWTWQQTIDIQLIMGDIGKQIELKY